MSIARPEFEAVAELAATIAKRRGVSTRIRALDDRDFSHVFVNADGRITTFGVEPTEEVLLGHLLADDLGKIVSSPVLTHTTDKTRSVDRFSAHE